MSNATSSRVSESLVSKTSSAMRKLARGRVNESVTADDVRNYLRKNKIVLSVNETISLVNSVLSGPTFYSYRTTKSTRPEAKGRRISVWALS